MGHNEKLLKLLQDKAEKRKLAHFYQLKLTSDPDKYFMESWLTPLIKSLFQISTPTSFERLLNSPDLLCIGLSPGLEQGQKEEPYSLDTISPLFSFSSSPPWEKPYRLAIIFNAHNLTGITSNKLLKILEEPAAQNILILLNSRQTQILPTLSSRAISLRLESFSKEEAKPELKGVPLHELIEKAKTDRSLERRYLLEYLKSAEENPCFRSKDELLHLAKWYKESANLKNSYQERLGRIYLALHKK